MSYNGSGTFNINSAGQPVVTGTVIASTPFNALTADLGTGLSTAITKDGQTTTTARIPFAAGINSSLVTDSTSSTTGSIITAGGVGVAKALFVGTTLNVAGASTLAAVTGTSIAASTVLQMPDGVVGTPGLRVGTSSSTGLFSSGDNTLRVASGGTQVALFTSTGVNSTAVGATTPAAGAFTTLSASSTLGVTGVATFTASPVISAITNTGTITLPTKTGTLALNTVTTQVFTASGANTYTRPTGLVYALVYIKAGGASGASSTSAGFGASGGEGEEAWGIFTAATIGASQTVTIGAGGAAVTLNTSAGGNAGGTTSFGALMTAAGASGGTQGNFGGAPAAGGSGGTGGIYRMRGAAGNVGSDTGGAATALYNAGGGKGGGIYSAAAGANSGGGGGGGATTANSGAGGSGICVVYEYY